MKKTFITVKGVEYEVKFSFSSLRIFLEMYGEKQFSAIDKYIKHLIIEPDTEPTFDFFDVLGNVILSGVLNAAQHEVNITSNDIIDSVMMLPEKVAELIDAFVKIVPNNDKGVKQVGKQQGKRKVPKK